MKQGDKLHHRDDGRTVIVDRVNSQVVECYLQGVYGHKVVIAKTDIGYRKRWTTNKPNPWTKGK